MFLSAFLAVGLLMAFWIGLPIAVEYFFHPARKQERRHQGTDFEQAVVELPYKSSDHTVWLETPIKYSGDDYYRQNRRPRIEGERWEKNWIPVESESLIETIEEQL